ncbi:MAG: hypothetical protein ACI9NC_000425 [Verrucomicrobiales bacterium]|jgi:hypothetical protein
MRPQFFSMFIGVLVLGSSLSASATLPAKQSKKEKQCSTLSELGIDFGAAELGRYAELGLSDAQKKQALMVVRDRRPGIEKLCARMTKALKMDEATLEGKRMKEIELAAILKGFKSVQSEIIGGLHALVTKKQMAKLKEIKKIEGLEVEKAGQRKEEAAG